MINASDRFVASRRDLWMQPDVARWIRPDAARFLAPGTCAVDAFPALDRKSIQASHVCRRAVRTAGSGRTGEVAVVGYNDPRVISDVDAEAILPGQPRSGGGVAPPFQLTASRSSFRRPKLRA